MKRLLAGLLWCVAGFAAAHEGGEESLDRINHSIETQPQSQQLYLRRGRLYSQMERHGEARADFDVAARIGPADRVAYDYGALCFQLEDVECALREFDRYIEAYPGDAAAYEYRSRAYQRIDEHSLALADLKQYFELSAYPAPGQYVTASQLAQALGQAEEGVAILDAGLSRLGLVPQLQRRAVEVELELGHVDEAIERWDTLRSVLRDSVDWKIEMIRLLLADGQTERAGLLLEQASAQLSGLRPTPARLRSGEAIAELEMILQDAGQTGANQSISSHRPSNTSSS